ncbi:MAG: hypothetical protein K2H03_05385, partial [Muribaculaceae bacterium]|nr:hypothetical protein [Muribaculaceae bacterium]
AGIEHIILSKENRKNVDDIPERYRSGLDFVYVDTISDVIKLALSEEPAIYPAIPSLSDQNQSI